MTARSQISEDKGNPGGEKRGGIYKGGVREEGVVGRLGVLGVSE